MSTQLDSNIDVVPYHDEPTREADVLSALGVEDIPDSPLITPARANFLLSPWAQNHPAIQQATIAWERVKIWCKGPQPPRPWRIIPIAAKYQALPIQIRDRYLPEHRHKIGALLLYYAVWLITFSLVLRESAFVTEVAGYGAPAHIGCYARFWSKNSGCGVNGDDCRPFDNSTFTFRCPASCLKAQTLEPYPVGGAMVNYRPLVIGGPMDHENPDSYAQSVYRGDSFICSSAIHSGFLKDSKGGCGVLKVIGERHSYPSIKKHGIKSIDFDSYFPQSFSFIRGTAASCHDLRWPLLAVSVTFSAIFSLFVTSPSLFFWTIFTALYIHVALVSDPPGFSDYHALISTGIGRFLPAAFCMAVMFLFSIRHTLHNLTAQIEKTILWLGACWVGSLNNYTFDKIPISRLNGHDLKQQPGAIPALLLIVSILASIMLSQAWFIRIEGLMPRYLAIYGILIGSILLLLAVPGQNLRIHHYILGLLLIPGTRLQMRPSLLYQGLLVGFFINGVARWGFDSILQTSFELRGDAPMGTSLPIILPPIIHANLDLGIPPNITFEWLSSSDDFDGISILVNDVERLKGYKDQGISSFTWVRTKTDFPEYFRFAFINGGDTGDFTRPGTWDKNLRWTQMESGPS